MTAGSQLRQARLNKGVLLKDASSKTKIQEKFLEALESDNFSVLPNIVYLKGFIRKYSEFLGLDPDKMLSLLDDKTETRQKQEIIIEDKKLPPVNTEKYFRKILIAVTGFFVAIGLVMLLVSFIGKGISSIKKQRPRPQAAARPKPLKKQQKKAVKQEAVVAKKPQPVVKEALSLDLYIAAKKSCYVSVKADQRLLFEGFLLVGASEQWKAKNMFELGISDGSAVEVMVNGKKIGQASKGVRNDLIITKDGIRHR